MTRWECGEVAAVLIATTLALVFVPWSQGLLYVLLGVAAYFGLWAYHGIRVYQSRRRRTR
ncbi:hypothetical protein AB0B89_29240 [Sphaerisporangium sp. NPDC049002]|uniref:hypothetical protein n=1 Tax=Sphaerisporangium sp. NPDC049002 TaxID=3155392 RepID=UPI00340036AB